MKTTLFTKLFVLKTKPVTEVLSVLKEKLALDHVSISLSIQFEL